MSAPDTVCVGCGTTIQQPPKGRRKWCSDRCRKTTAYSAPCADCGTVCRTSDRLPDPAVEYRCHPCASRQRRTWTREKCVEAVRAFAARNGGRPPIAHERMVSGDRSLPYSATATTLFGGWNALLIAAGFSPRPGGPANPVRVAAAEAER